MMKRKMMIWLVAVLFIGVGALFPIAFLANDLQAAEQTAQTAQVAQSAISSGNAGELQASGTHASNLAVGYAYPDFSWQDGQTVTLGRKLQLVLYSAGYLLGGVIVFNMLRNHSRR